jgi:hypothetical protein
MPSECVVASSTVLLQAQLLLREATAAAEAVHTLLLPPEPAARCPTQHIKDGCAAGSSPVAAPCPPRGVCAQEDDTLLEAVALLMHLLQCVLELGIKDEWLHVLAGGGSAKEAAFVAARAMNFTAPSASAMLQVLSCTHALQSYGSALTSGPVMSVNR